MTLSNRTAVVVLGAVLGAAGLAIGVQDRPAPADGPKFLEVGKDYIIHFLDASNIFKTTSSGVSTATYKNENGETTESRPASWTVTLKVESFKVVAIPSGNWVLLEHPTNLDDIPQWNEQRRALAILRGPNVEAIKAEANGPARLMVLKKAAEVRVATSQTWVNLNQAIAMAPVPAEEVGGKLTVKSMTVGRDNPQ